MANKVKMINTMKKILNKSEKKLKLIKIGIQISQMEMADIDIYYLYIY